MKSSKSVIEFEQMCSKYGFTKRKNGYSRCIGDGIYQCIFTDSLKSRTSTLPRLSQRNDSAYIKIGIWSMYADLPSFYFDEKCCFGEFYPENLVGESFDKRSFKGFDKQCKIMMDVGFQKLNEVITQKSLVDIVGDLQLVQYGYVLPHQIYLCAPYALSGDLTSARSILYGIYAQNWLNFHAKNDSLKKENKIMEYIHQESLFEEKMQNITDFLCILLGKNMKNIQAYLVSFLNRNIRLAQSKHIPFIPFRTEDGLRNPNRTGDGLREPY